MADGLAYTPGSGAVVKTDQGTTSGQHMQVMKLAYSADGDETLLAVDADGLKVNIGKSVDLSVKPKASEVFPVNDNSGSLTVDDGGSSITVDAPNTTPLAVRLSSGSGWVDALPVTDGGGVLSVDDGGATLSVDDGAGSLTVDGTVTANQGTAVAASGAWPTKITDGSSVVGITTLGGDKALKVDVLQITGTVTVDPAGTTPQPVLLRDEAAAAFTEANPLPVALSRGEQARVSCSVAITASQTASTVWDPASAKKFVITDMILVLSVGGALTLFDGTDAAVNYVENGTYPVGRWSTHFERPWPSAAADNILKYTSGTGITGNITVHGYEV